MITRYEVLKNNKAKRITIRMTPELHRLLKTYGLEQNRAVSNIVENFVIEGLKKHGKIK